MTKDETIKIMAMLGAFYSGGKNDPKAQAKAWHLILADYDFGIAQQAVLNFAKSDTRDYATFPTVGKIIAEIERMKKRKLLAVNEVLMGISYGRDFDMLSGDGQELIPKETYEAWLKVDPEEFSKNMKTYRVLLEQRQALLVASNE